MKNAKFTVIFSMHTPIRQKDFEELPTKKLVIDTYPEPYKGAGRYEIINL